VSGISAGARPRLAFQLRGEDLPADAERFQGATGGGVPQSI
jgi:hypothetical protein